MRLYKYEKTSSYIFELDFGARHCHRNKVLSVQMFDNHTHLKANLESTHELVVGAIGVVGVDVDNLSSYKINSNWTRNVINNPKET